MVRDLARKHKSGALSHLALRMASAIRASFRVGNDDPFQKVKGLIQDMLAKLMDEANQDASHKAYCDKEMAESKAKQEDKTDEIEKLTTSIDQMAARSAQLKEEVAELQSALAELASSQAEMDKLRTEEHSGFEANKAEAEKGLQGIKTALKVLREYYGETDKSHAAAEGAGGGIISLLEVCESDFTKGLAEMEATEDASQAEYEQVTKENQLEKATKDQDVKYKTKESTDLDKASSETSTDLSSVQAELQAVNEYYAKLKEECVEKAEPYEQRKARREAELAGLKEALGVLDGNAVLLQRSSRRSLRSVHAHSAA
jgi:chromosome segregation ATPase